MMAETTQTMPLLAADGTPLKLSLSRSLRQQKLRALLLISPLLIFVMLTFVLPIGNMLFRSVQNDIVSNIMPHTVIALEDWKAERGQLPEDSAFKAAFYDLFAAAKAKEHTKLGTRLNYEQTGISSTFRKSGRAVTKAKLWQQNSQKLTRHGNRQKPFPACLLRPGKSLATCLFKASLPV